MFFEEAQMYPADPIFGIAKEFQEDKRDKKVDLSVGIYRDENLLSNRMECIALAEEKIAPKSIHKTYLPMRGDIAYLDLVGELVFGKGFYADHKDKIFSFQSIGGTGALRVAGELIAREFSCPIYVPEQTWANHRAIFSKSRLDVKSYPYFHADTHNLNFQEICSFIETVPKKSVLVLHVCCHNPTGCDFTKEMWQELSKLCFARELLPFFDFAYQGFASSIEDDAYPVRYFASKGHEMFVTYSGSKSFGLYGERIGAFFAYGKHGTYNIESSSLNLIRGNYSNPPRHGAALIKTILQDQKLRFLWENELNGMRERIISMRVLLKDALAKLNPSKDFSFLTHGNGMFSLLGMEKEKVFNLAKEDAIYMPGSSRINFAGLNNENIEIVAKALSKGL